VSEPLVIVANRLPVEPSSSGGQAWTRTPGGLVSALATVIANRKGTWVGWGGFREQGEHYPSDTGFDLRLVELDEDEVDGYYDGFANLTLWPLYHAGVEPAEFHRHWWSAYQRVNARFANVAAEVAPERATVWVHDYHLQLVPAMLRAARPDLRIGFYLHIPFPPAELFLQLPWRRQILAGMLGADVIGFQVPDGARNFSRLAVRLCGARPIPGAVVHEGRPVRLGAFPISIDTQAWERLATSPAVEAGAAALRAELGDPRSVLLGIDRLDSTKGIASRLRAFEELLANGRVKAPETVLVQIAVPSRDRSQAYRRQREAVEQLVGRINGEYGEVGGPAVHYIHQALTPVELAALYRAADMMLVTSLQDGMNLVAKEYVASRVSEPGVLILSEFAGAAHELRSALLVNPYDLDGLQDVIVRGLELPMREMRRRMRSLRRVVSTNTVYTWSDRFLTLLEHDAS
jgi:alpha,alpha-trehalose-phosphate synthase [UDP-forming]